MTCVFGRSIFIQIVTCHINRIVIILDVILCSLVDSLDVLCCSFSDLTCTRAYFPFPPFSPTLSTHFPSLIFLHFLPLEKTVLFRALVPIGSLICYIPFFFNWLTCFALKMEEEVSVKDLYVYTKLHCIISPKILILIVFIAMRT
jgi:hypothetical protein